MKAHILAICSILSFFAATNIQSQTPKNFAEAKRIIYRIHSESDHKRTFYCHCRYSKHKAVDLNSCGYIPRKNKKRARRVEIEHIVPTRVFGYSRRCWREPICRKRNGTRYKGRECCRKIDPVFREMESDLHNLVPAVGEIEVWTESWTKRVVS